VSTIYNKLNIPTIYIKFLNVKNILKILTFVLYFNSLTIDPNIITKYHTRKKDKDNQKNKHKSTNIHS
jgi:hypothetical protein